MKVEIEKSKSGQCLGEIVVRLNPFDLIHDHMTDEDRVHLIESLSCHEAIIKNVIDQLVHGCTDNGFGGSWSASMTTALQEGKLKLVEHLSEMENKTITDLQNRIASLEKDVVYWQTESSKERRW